MKRQIVALALGALVVLAAGCARSPAGVVTGGGPPETDPAGAALVRDLTPGEFSAYLAGNPDAVLIDLRLPIEITGELAPIDHALFIPMHDLERRVGELPPDRRRPILLYDRTGVNSGIAAQTLVREGYREVITLLGGLAAYREAGY